MKNLEVMVVLFIIVILGYVACKLGYMGDKFDKKLSSIVVDITCPLLVLSSVMGDELPDRTLILPLLGVGFLTYILLLVFGFGVPRLISKNHDDQGMIGFALMFANVGFIGYPIVSSIFGPQAIFYAALLNMPNTFFIFTAGVMLIKGEYSVKQFNPKLPAVLCKLLDQRIPYGWYPYGCDQPRHLLAGRSGKRRQPQCCRIPAVYESGTEVHASFCDSCCRRFHFFPQSNRSCRSGRPWF